MLNALSDIQDKVKALQCGGVDRITKPFRLEEVLARVGTHLKTPKPQKRLAYQNENLQLLVENKVKQLSEAHLATIFAIAKLSENRDEDTGKHLERVQNYCRSLALQLRADSSYSGQISEKYPDLIHHASPLHDVGEIAIPDNILLKPDKLTTEEFTIMKTHATICAATLRSINATHHDTFLRMGIDIPGAQQERWDGSGYPLELREKIPLSARIMAVADVYVALRSERCYKKAFDHTLVVDIIRGDRGTHFDPVVVDAFLVLEKAFDHIRRTLV